MRACGGLEGPFSIWCLPANIFWRVKTGPATPAERKILRAGAVLGYFRVIGRSLWGHPAYLCIILRLLCASDGYFEVGLPHFQKNTHFPDFNDFIILWGQLGAILGSLGGCLGRLLGHFGVTFGIWG